MELVFSSIFVGISFLIIVSLLIIPFFLYNVISNNAYRQRCKNKYKNFKPTKRLTFTNKPRILVYQKGGQLGNK